MRKSSETLYAAVGYAWKFLRGKMEQLLMLYLFLILGIIILASFLIWKEYTYALRERVIALQNRSYWLSVIALHPNYPDAYYKLALAEVRLRDRVSARIDLDRALKLDSGFREAKKLQGSILQ